MWIYQYLLYNPQLNITPFNFNDPNLLQKAYASENFDYIFCLNVSCNSFVNIDKAKLLWSSQEEKTGTIVKLPDRVMDNKK